MKTRPPVLLVLFALFLLSLCSALTFIRDARKAKSAGPPIYLQLPIPYLRATSLTFDEMAADILWIRFLQNIPLSPPPMGTRQWLANQAHAIVKLDPAFDATYYRLAIILAVTGMRPKAGLEIIKMGMERSPDSWHMPFLAGYLCFYELKDPACGAEFMRLVTTIEGHPTWIKSLTARLLAEAGDPDGAITFLKHWISASDNNPILQKGLTSRLDQAIMTRDLMLLNDAVREFNTKKGRPPGSLRALIREGFMGRIPLEPHGASYKIDNDGTVISTSGKEIFKVHRAEEYYKDPHKESEKDETP